VTWLCITFASLTPSQAAQGPDWIATNGQILTTDAGFHVAKAMAVRGDRIVAVGTNEEILALADQDTKVTDLQGKCVLPGLIDSHVHATGASIYEFDHSIPSMQSITDVLEYVRGRVAVVPEGKWIYISQVFVTRLDDQRFPTRQELDSVAPGHPVCFRTGPDASLNSLALKLNQIDRDYQLPAGVPAKIERDPINREPTGIIRNFDKLIKVTSSERTPSTVEKQDALARLLADYNSVGLTSIAERSASEDTVALYQALKDEGRLTCRAFLNWSVDPNAEWVEIEKKVLQGAEHPAHAYDPWIWLRGVKVFLDGGMLTGSAYMRSPWGVSQIYSIDDPNYQGLLYIQPERLYRLAKLCLEHDLQFTAHAVGDGAVHTLLEAYRQVNEDFSVRESRPCITHCNFMSAEAIELMSQLGVVADLQPAWLWLDGKTLEKQFGKSRLTYFQPYHSLFEKGVIVGGGSDHMQKVGGLRSVNPYNPFLGMWIALERIPRGADGPLHAEQRINRQQALRLYTINNAYLLLDEKNRGSLEVGKLADFVVIDRDFLACPVDEVRDIQVEQTYVGGKRVYQR
jgi:predicted amidohydrolase YtcJ